jgi:hypothetical protein
VIYYLDYRKESGLAEKKDDSVVPWFRLFSDIKMKSNIGFFALFPHSFFFRGYFFVFCTVNNNKAFIIKKAS